MPLFCTAGPLQRGELEMKEIACFKKLRWTFAIIGRVGGVIGLPALLQLVGMRRAQDDINHIREFRQNLRKSVQDMLNSLVGRKQPERE